MNQKEEKPLISTLLVFIQFAGMLVALIVGNPYPESKTLFVLSILGIALIIWAVVTMRRNFRVYPEVRKGNKMVTDGPFKLFRHPIYSGVLLTTGAWLLGAPSITGAMVWAVLVADLVVKLKREEKNLMNHFKEYAEYRKGTYRLVPFIY